MWKCRMDSLTPTCIYVSAGIIINYYTFIPIEKNVTWNRLVSGTQIQIEYHEIYRFKVKSLGQRYIRYIKHGIFLLILAVFIMLGYLIVVEKKMVIDNSHYECIYIKCKTILFFSKAKNI